MSPHTTLLVLVLAAAVPLSRAGVIFETAAGGTPATAQLVDMSQFTLPQPPSTFPFGPTLTIRGSGGGNDVDFYRLQLANPFSAIFDIDDQTVFDPFLALFDSTGTLIAYNDDSGNDPGSSSALHSFIGVIHLPAGTYFLAISEALNPASASLSNQKILTGLLRPDGELGGYRVSGAAAGNASFLANGAEGTDPYTLYISINQIPEPSSVILLGLGLAGIAVYYQRRRA